MLSFRDYHRVRAMLRYQTMEQIAAGYFEGKWSAEELTKKSDATAAYIKADRQKRRQDMVKAMAWQRTLKVGTPRLRPDESVVAERDRVMSLPHTLNQLILGDPAPTRSALDKKRALECTS